jgi:hypothetical protein
VLNLNAITEVLPPATVEEVKERPAGSAWMPGGTRLKIDDVAHTRVEFFKKESIRLTRRWRHKFRKKPKKYHWNERNEN